MIDQINLLYDERVSRDSNRDSFSIEPILC